MQTKRLKICKKEFDDEDDDDDDDNNYPKSCDHCYTKYITLNEIPIVLHNKSNYHNHFITRELAEES